MPILVFLFLKFFGKNEFSVEPLFQSEIHAPVECNGVDYQVPYIIHDSVLTKVQGTELVKLIVFRNLVDADQHEQSIQMTRIVKEFSKDPLRIVSVVTGNDSTDVGVEAMQVLKVSGQESKSIRSCVFLMPPANDAVVIDLKGRIMGQYTLTDREDTDRLIVELKIMLKKY